MAINTPGGNEHGKKVGKPSSLSPEMRAVVNDVMKAVKRGAITAILAAKALSTMGCTINVAGDELIVLDEKTNPVPTPAPDAGNFNRPVPAVDAGGGKPGEVDAGGGKPGEQDAGGCMGTPDAGGGKPGDVDAGNDTGAEVDANDAGSEEQLDAGQDSAVDIDGSMGGSMGVAPDGGGGKPGNVEVDAGGGKPSDVDAGSVPQAKAKPIRRGRELPGWYIENDKNKSA